jgi:hypothetical protein
MGAGSSLESLKMTGYVTTVESIRGRTNFELEQALGFGEGTLAPASMSTGWSNRCTRVTSSGATRPDILLDGTRILV